MAARSRIALLILALVACGPLGDAVARPRRKNEPVKVVKPDLHELEAEFRQLSSPVPGVRVSKVRRLDLLHKILEIGDIAALQVLVAIAKDPTQDDIRHELLELLARSGDDSDVLAQLFREHDSYGDPYRRLARDFRLARAVRRRDEALLLQIFKASQGEDRFAALRSLGAMESRFALEAARALLDDAKWRPDAEEGIGCSTLALALKKLEGPETARLLLRMRQDPRFLESDRGAVLKATRTWRKGNLLEYVDLSTLASSNQNLRIESALFMGAARIEMARAPLLLMARDRSEDSAVRAAAALSLGSLRIARADLADDLADLLSEPEPTLRSAAVAGLGELGVRQSAELLVALLGGPLDEEARTALAKCTGQPISTDWLDWLKRDASSLPEGT